MKKFFAGVLLMNGILVSSATAAMVQESSRGVHENLQAGDDGHIKLLASPEGDFGRQKEALWQEKFRDIELGRQYLGNIWFSDGEGVPAQSIEEFSQSLGKILWALYFDSLDQKGVIVEEMTFQVQDQGGKLFDWLLKNNHAQARVSSHFAEEKIQQYGITVSFHGVQLPAGKQHILFGKFSDGRLFIKPENFGLEASHFISHAGEFLVAQANKKMPQFVRDFFGIVSDDHESSAKERVPENVKKEALRFLRQADSEDINKELSAQLIESHGLRAIIGILQGLNDEKCSEYAEELKKKYPDWQLRKGNELILGQAFVDKIKEGYSKENLKEAIEGANFSFKHELYSVPSPTNEEDFLVISQIDHFDKDEQEAIEQKKKELREYVMQQFSALVEDVSEQLLGIPFSQAAEVLSEEQRGDLNMAIERAFNETFGMRKITEFRGVIEDGEKFSQLQNAVKALQKAVEAKAVYAQNQSDANRLKAVCKFALENWQLFYTDFIRSAESRGAFLLNGAEAQSEFKKFEEGLLNDLGKIIQQEKRMQAINRYYNIIKPAMIDTVGVAWSREDFDKLLQEHLSSARRGILPPSMDEESAIDMQGKNDAIAPSGMFSSISDAASQGVGSVVGSLSSWGKWAFSPSQTSAKATGR